MVRILSSLGISYSLQVEFFFYLEAKKNYILYEYNSLPLSSYKNMTVNTSLIKTKTKKSNITLLTNFININPLNAKLNPICHLLPLLGAHIFSTLAG